MPFHIEISKSAQKDLSSLDLQVRQRVLKRLVEMQSDPFKSAVKLAGSPGLFRVRVSDWRIIFIVSGQSVIVQRVGHRREIYDRL